MKKLLFILSLVVISSQQVLFAGTISFDQLATSSDLTVAKYNADMDRVYQKINTAIATDNVTNDTLLEADMADEINPRIRTYEGASCEYTDDGLLTTTTSGTLTGSVPTGTAYPRGFRCDKTSSTPKTFTATKWTFVDIDQSCNFQYSEVAIDSATPSIAANSIRLSRVSTDGTEITAVQDLRTTSCTGGPFENISDSTGEATLDDLFAFGRNRISGDVGWIQGTRISYDTSTTFAVTPGSVYINGKFRRNTSNTSVGTSNDAPATGGSGLDTGAIGASTRYHVYAVADQDAVKTFSVSYSTNASNPTGVTNYRKIGHIYTSGDSKFQTSDLMNYHSLNDFETPAVAVNFNGTGTIAINQSHNVSSLTDRGTGLYTVNFRESTASADYVFVGMARVTSDVVLVGAAAGAFPSTSSFAFDVINAGAAATDADRISIAIFGDKNK